MFCILDCLNWGFHMMMASLRMMTTLQRIMGNDTIMKSPENYPTLADKCHTITIAVGCLLGRIFYEVAYNFPYIWKIKSVQSKIVKKNPLREKAIFWSAGLFIIKLFPIILCNVVIMRMLAIIM